MQQTTCRSCGRRVFFAVDENERTQILDAVAPCYELDGGYCRRERAVFVSHFATCPNASAHSKKSKAKKTPPVRHGVDCSKVLHNDGSGYMHDAEDDRPYDVDGLTFCGRCHIWLPAKEER